MSQDSCDGASFCESCRVPTQRGVGLLCDGGSSESLMVTCDDHLVPNFTKGDAVKDSQRLLQLEPNVRTSSFGIWSHHQQANRNGREA